MMMRARRAFPAWGALLPLILVGVLILAPGPGAQVEAWALRVVAPLQIGISQLVNGASHTISTVGQAGDLARQNALYREEMDRLQAVGVQMRELELENRDLRRLLDLRERAPLGSLLSVNVIAQDPLSVVRAVVVDRGSDDGVSLNTPVITWRGVVGRVVEVRPNSSKVLLVTDVNSAVSARIQDPNSRATGVVRGTGDGRLLMQYVPRTDLLRTGDLVITSGIGGLFPSGVVIGRVTQVRQRDVEVFQEALVEPAADLRNLERLYIVNRVAAPGVTQPD